MCSWFSIPVYVTKKLVSTNKDLTVPRDIDEILRERDWFAGVLVRESSVEFLADNNCSSHTSLLGALTSGDPQFNVLRTCNPTDIFLCFKLFKDRGLSLTPGCNGEVFVQTDPYFYEAGPTVGCPNFFDMIQQLSVSQDVASLQLHHLSERLPSLQLPDPYPVLLQSGLGQNVVVWGIWGSEET